MKRLFKSFVFRCLRFCARRYLKKFPSAKIISVTGSIGKTSTKDAIAHVLASRYTVVKSEKSMNTEFGLPLAILELESGYDSFFLWIKILSRAIKKAFSKPANAIDYFVLEYGVDKPGDMDRLLRVAHPDMAVFTGVAPVHLENGQFSSVEAIRDEKAKLVKSVSKNGLVLLNDDDPLVNAIAPEVQAKVYRYGTLPECKPCATDIAMDWNGISFTMQYGNIRENFFSPIVGMHHVMILLPAIVCGMQCGLYPRDISEILMTFRLPPGRLNVLSGIRGSTIIDSSYNASPQTVQEAVKTVYQLCVDRPRRKIFVFGAMNELGALAENAHREIGRLIVNDAMPKADFFVTVGSYARLAADEACKRGFPRERIASFDTALDAAHFVQNLLQQDDVVLVKGSQNRVRLERLVKLIMAEPEKADWLLVRQDAYWKTH